MKKKKLKRRRQKKIGKEKKKKKYIEKRKKSEEDVYYTRVMWPTRNGQPPAKEGCRGAEVKKGFSKAAECPGQVFHQRFSSGTKNMKTCVGSILEYVGWFDA